MRQKFWRIFVILAVMVNLFSAGGAGIDPVLAAQPMAALSSLSVTPEVVDPNLYSGLYNDIAIDPDGVPHIAYFYNDDDGTDDGMLMMASRHGGMWGWEEIDASVNMTGVRPSIAIDEDGLAHIAYYDQTNGDLRYGKQLTPDGWDLVTVDSSGVTGMNTSLALDSLQQPHIAYWGGTGLKYATFDGSTWQITEVPGTTDLTSDSSISLALTSANSPRIAYRKMVGQLPSGLGYTWHDGTSWSVETAFSSTAVGDRFSMALDEGNNPHISFMLIGGGLRYIVKTTAWQAAEVVVDNALIGSLNNLALDPSGLPRIAYYDGSTSPGSIGYAYKDGGTWRKENLAISGSSPDLTFGPAGDAHISFQNSEGKLGYIPLSPLPDLQVTDVWLKDLRIYFQLYNAGLGAAPAGHAMALLVNGVPISPMPTITVVIPPGGRYESSFSKYTWGCTPGNNVPVSVTVDSLFSIVEISDSNNTLEETWLCRGPKPVITAGPAVSDITQTTATITWATSTATDSLVTYGRRAGFLNLNKSDPAQVTSHSVTLTGLLSGTSYAYKVTSTDSTGQAVSSNEVFFTTSPVGGTVSSAVTRSITRDAGPGEIYTLKAAVPGATGNEKVEFFYQLTPSSPRVLIGTAFSGTPTGSGTVEFATKFSPGKTGLKRDELANASIITQVSVLGGSAENFEDILDAFQPLEPEIAITTPEPDWTRYLTTTDYVPLGTKLPVSAYASAFEWECDWAGTGLQPDCNEVDKPVEKVIFTLIAPSGNNVVVVEPGIDEYLVSAEVLIGGLTVGDYTITATAYHAGLTKTTSTTIHIIQATPEPGMTRSVARIGNTFRVTLTITNDAAATGSLTVDKLFDYVRGFQPVFKDTGDVRIGSSYDPTTRTNRVTLDLWDGGNDLRTIPIGGSYPFSYDLVPIIYESNDQYLMGNVTLVYERNGEIKTRQFNLPAATLLDPSPAMVTLANSVAKALKEDDYLLVTHPANLKSVYGSQTGEPNWNTLLRRMAELANIRQGALVFIDTQDADTLDDLLTPVSHTWADRLHPNYGKYAQGYVLLVGEDNIVPSYTKTGLLGGTVRMTDNQLAHTGGSSGAPDLVLGRIPGNDIPQLIKPIETSLKVLRGELTNYRSKALGTSGTGDGVQDFQDGAENVKANLESLGVSVTLYHEEERARTDKITVPFDDGDLLAGGDLDGDGDQELVIGDVSTDDIYIVSFTSMGYSRELWFHYADDIKSGHGFVVGNIDADPQAELLIADDNDMVYIFDNVNDTTMNLIQPFDNWDKLTLGELDGDAAKEIIIAHGGGIVSRNGDGSPSTAAFPLSFGDSDDLVAGQFLDTDGIDEIALMDASANKGLIIRSDGSVTPFDAVYSAGDFAIAADIDGNSRDEIWVMNSAGDSVQGYHTFAPEPKAFYIPQRVIEGDKIAAITIAGESSPAIWLVKRDDNTYQLDRDYPDYMQALYVGASSGADYLYYNGHGSAQSWENVRVDMNPVPNFGTAAPLAFGTTCLSGDYSPLNSKSMSERMLWWGAGAFIGSTEVAYSSFDENAANWFSHHFKDTGPFARLLLEYKNKKWDDGTNYENADWPYWGHEYAFYGDAKFGFIGDTTVLPYPDAAPRMAESTLLHVDVPAYTVVQKDGFDYVDIPDGDVTTGVGQPRIPYYVVTQDYPAGTRVSGVTLTARSGKSTASGLNLPDYVLEIDGSGEAVVPRESLVPTQPSAPDEIDWTPSPDEIFTWLVNERADGSSQLVIRLNPFYYSPATTNVEYYQSYDFEIETSSTKQEITRLDSDKSTYRLNEPVSVEAQIRNNSSGDVDLLVSATLYNAGGSPVSGADMRVLTGLAGDSTAGYGASFDTNALPVGSYYVEMELRNPTSGDVIDTDTVELELGMTSAQVKLTADPTFFQAGETVSINLAVTNDGDLPLSGAEAQVVVLDPYGVVVASFSEMLSDLAAGASFNVPFSWDTISASEQKYVIEGRVLYNSRATPVSQASVMVPLQVFLPVTMK